MNTLKLFTFALAVPLLCSCQRAPDQEHSEAEIRAAIQNWVAVFDAEDLDGVLASYSQDLILSYPGEEDMATPQRFRDLYEGAFAREGGHYTFTADIEEVGIYGHLAFARVIWTLTWHPDDAPPHAARVERALEIWRNEEDGVWRLYRWMGYPIAESP